jgi:hypothetical protein
MDTAHEKHEEQQGDGPPEQREQRKAPGRPFQAGDPRINRQGRPRKDAEAEVGEEATAPSGELDLLGDMEAVLKQPKSQDRGETQKVLRRLLDEDVKGFMALLARQKEKPSECAVCAARKAEEALPMDEGTQRALAVAEERLRGWGVSCRFGSEVGGRWGKLTVDQRRLILETAGVACTAEFLGTEPVRNGEGRRHAKV